MPMRLPSEPRDGASYLKGYNDAKLDYEVRHGRWHEWTVNKMSEWIPVSERLPVPNEYVKRVRKSYLVQNVYDDMMVATYQQDNNGKRVWVQTYAFDPIADEIVAWRELPDPYKDGEQDG